jgi:hypothetical protein
MINSKSCKPLNAWMTYYIINKTPWLFQLHKENDGIQINDPICRLCHKKCIKDQTNFMLHF